MLISSSFYGPLVIVESVCSLVSFFIFVVFTYQPKGTVCRQSRLKLLWAALLPWTRWGNLQAFCQLVLVSRAIKHLVMEWGSSMCVMQQSIPKLHPCGSLTFCNIAPVHYHLQPFAGPSLWYLFPLIGNSKWEVTPSPQGLWPVSYVWLTLLLGLKVFSLC
jgi:hypothetical protein